MLKKSKRVLNQNNPVDEEEALFKHIAALLNTLSLLYTSQQKRCWSVKKLKLFGVSLSSAEERGDVFIPEVNHWSERVCQFLCLSVPVCDVPWLKYVEAETAPSVWVCLLLNRSEVKVFSPQWSQ